MKWAVLAGFILALIVVLRPNDKLWDRREAWTYDSGFIYTLIKDESAVSSVDVVQIYGMDFGGRTDFYDLEQERKLPLIGELRDKDAIARFFHSLSQKGNVASDGKASFTFFHILAFDSKHMRFTYAGYDLAVGDKNTSGQLAWPYYSGFEDNPTPPEVFMNYAKRAKK